MNTRNFALIFGIIFLVVGIAGFIPGLVTYTAPVADTAPDAAPAADMLHQHGYLLGLFPVNFLHNLFHIAWGVFGLATYRSFSNARLFARATAIVYGLLTVMGLIPGLNTLFGLLPLYGNDIWLHALLALIAAYFGFARPAETRHRGHDRPHRHDGGHRSRALIRSVLGCLLQAAVLWGCGLLVSGSVLACPGAGYCEVRGGRYLALPPPGWDGQRPIAATIFFHGWQSSAEAFAQDAAFTASFAAEGVMLVLPDGINKTWAHQGSPSQARDEIAFMDAVRADMLARWPIDPGRILVTGFSQGGSMVWDLACRRGRDYHAFVAVAGAFWEPMPDRCTGGPVDLLHIHGTADPVVPMAGRSIRDTWKQADVLAGLAVLRGLDACPAAPNRHEEIDGLDCAIWSDCATGRELRLCEHGGGHVMPPGWVGFAHAWAHGLSAATGGG